MKRISALIIATVLIVISTELLQKQCYINLNEYNIAEATTNFCVDRTNGNICIDLNIVTNLCRDPTTFNCFLYDANKLCRNNNYECLTTAKEKIC